MINQTIVNALKKEFKNPMAEKVVPEGYKIAIDWEGEECLVTIDTVVNTSDKSGVSRHYLLTADEQAEYDAKNAAWEAGKEDRAWRNVRDKRDELLKATDYVSMPDYPQGEFKTKILIYRENLRNLPSQFKMASDVIFPEKPQK